MLDTKFPNGIWPAKQLEDLNRILDSSERCRQDRATARRLEAERKAEAKRQAELAAQQQRERVEHLLKAQLRRVMRRERRQVMFGSSLLIPKTIPSSNGKREFLSATSVNASGSTDDEKKMVGGIPVAPPVAAPVPASVALAPRPAPARRSRFSPVHRQTLRKIFVHCAIMAFAHAERLKNLPIKAPSAPERRRSTTPVRPKREPAVAPVRMDFTPDGRLLSPQQQLQFHAVRAGAALTAAADAGRARPVFGGRAPRPNVRVPRPASAATPSPIPVSVAPSPARHPIVVAQPARLVSSGTPAGGALFAVVHPAVADAARRASLDESKYQAVEARLHTSPQMQPPAAVRRRSSRVSLMDAGHRPVEAAHSPTTEPPRQQRQPTAALQHDAQQRMSVRERIAAIEDMADLVRHIRQHARILVAS